MLFSQTFYGLLFCYLTITDVHVTLYLQIIDFPFPSCCTSQAPKKLKQIITVNSSTNTPRSYHQKNNSCTLCVPMFCLVCIKFDKVNCPLFSFLNFRSPYSARLCAPCASSKRARQLSNQQKITL